MKTLNLYFIAHGRTLANEEGKFISSTDLPLVMESADELENYADKGIYPYVDVVYSAPHRRCSQTAILIYPGVPITTVPNFKEYDFGAFEGKKATDLEKDEKYIKWITGEVPTPPDGEDNKDFALRLYVGLRQIVEDMLDSGYNDAAVIMPGGAIMTLFDACAIPRRHKLEWQADHGLGYKVKVTPNYYHSSGVIEVIGEIGEEKKYS